MVIRLSAFLILLAVVSPAFAQQPDSVPERTVEARRALAAAQWEEVESGLSALQAVTDSGLAMTAIRISPEKFTLSVAVRTESEGERVEAFGEREGAAVAVNGGFFGEREENGELFSVGLLREKGHDHSPAWTNTGGFLLLSPQGAAILPTVADLPDSALDVIQSKPLLIEPGGKWAMNSNQEHLRKRSIVCLKADGSVVLFLVTRAGLSLYEAGWLMRGSDVGGFFGCDAALALDGGGSTQIWFAGREDLSFVGETPVHDALIVKRR